jgi:hypothetical protein
MIPEGEVEGSRPMVLEGSTRVRALEVEGPRLVALCYCHNLDRPEVGHGARWAWRITITSLRIGPCADDWGQKGRVNIDIGS